MNKIINIILCILILVAGASCSIKKRAYRSGYYVEWKGHHGHVSTSTQSKSKQINLKPEYNEVVNQNFEAIVSSEKETILPVKNNKPNIFTKDVCEDVITMKSGEEIKAKVIEINENEIKYKRCDNLDGPLITVKKNEVFMIKYANGTKEIIKDEKPANTTKSNNPPNKNQAPQGDQPPKVHPLAIASILCSTVGWLIGVGPIVGLILGVQSLKEINAQPLRYTGKGFAIAGIVLGILYVLFAILILFILIAALFSI